MTCSHCHAPIGPGDAFCEACGTDLVGAAASDGDGAAATSTSSPVDVVSEGPKTSQITRVVEQHGSSTHGRACLVCGGTVDPDGFCTVCGQKAPTARDHWTETPSSWVGGVCDKGIAHARNEDAMAIAATVDRTRGVLVVCDGVTSAPESDRASIAAARIACRALTEAPPAASASFPARLSHWEGQLRDACRLANAETVGVARRLGDPPEPPSCTFVAGVVDTDLVSVAWCGDSRAYWLPDGGEGVQLGVDHSVGAQLIASGVSVADAERDPGFHTITRWLGADSYDPTPECVSRRVDVPGWVLVCSDGLWNYSSEPAELAALVASAVRDGATDPTAIAESLAAFANGCGGHDNITVVLARIDATSTLDRHPAADLEA